MRIVKIVTVCAALFILTPSPAAAQDKAVHFNIGGGPTFLMGDLGEAFNTGWGPAFGVTFDVSDLLGLQFEYAYRRFEVDDYIDAQAGRLSANHTTHQLDFNLIMNLNGPDGPARVYAVLGPGAYQRSVEITEYVGTGIICDPYFYICGSYPVEAILQSRGGWDFGFNVGGGVGIRIGETAEFTIEMRYHYVAGPEIQPEATPFDLTGAKTTGHYRPLTFGFRF